MTDQKRNQILLVLFLGVLMGALDIAIVAPALPAVQTAFGVDDRALTWTFSIYVLFNLIGTPLMAKLSDTYGRRSIYVLDVVLFALGSLVVALAPAGVFGVVLAGRALQGFGAGGIFPVASAVIGDTFPPEKRGSALGLIGAVFGLAFLVGPILGGVILTVAGWQWLFIINLPIAAVVAVMALRLLPTTRPDVRKPFDLAGMAVLGVMLAALAYGLNQIDTQTFVASLLSPGVWPFLVVAIGLALVFPLVERRAADPVLNLSLFRRRQTVLAGLLSAGAGLGEVGMVFIPSLAIAALPGVVDQRSASYMLLPVVLALGVGSPLVGRLLDRWGSKVVVLAGAALLAVGMMLLSWPAVTGSLWTFIVAGAVVGLGLSALLGAPVRYIMLNEASPTERTTAQGALALFTSVGQLVSSALVGAIADSLGGGVSGYGAAYLTTGVIALVMVAMAFGLKSREQERATVAATAPAVGPRMTPDLVIAVVCMLAALTLYTVAVWAERFAGRLKPWHLALFWAGLIFDTAGTSLMSAMAGSLQFDFHGITGALGLFFMLGHTLWASVALLLKLERILISFHKFSLAVWALWLVAFFSGVVGSMLR